jgi:hypothetical protein
MPALDLSHWTLLDREPHGPDERNQYPFTFEVWSRPRTE